MKKDARLYPRFDYSCSAQCAFLDKFPETFPVTVVNLSPEGMGFITEKPMEVGMSVYFIMDLDSGESVKFITKVRWAQKVPNANKYKIGVKIFDPSRTDLQKFIRFYCRCLIPGDEQRKKILVIESKKNTVKALYDVLSQEGYIVSCAYDGKSGFYKYMDERPNLIIVNFRLPKLSGYEICRNVRKLQNDQNTAIFMVIDKKKDIKEVVADGIGIQKYFIKPLKIEHILKEANNHLGLSKDT